MQFDWVTFGFQVVNVLALLAILRHFLFRPVADIIQRRQAEARAAADAVAAAKAEAETAAETARREAERTAAARRDLLGAAEAEAERRRADLLAAARDEAAKIVADAHAAAAHTVAAAETETLRRARDLAETIARRALGDLPDPPTVAGFADRLAAALAAMPEARRRALLAEAEFKLVAPRPLSPEESAAVRAALAPYGVDAPTVEADPSLIAGLELRAASGVVRNSLAHDLGRIAEALNGGD